MEILTLREARNRNVHRYYDGKPCRNGHQTLRYTKTGACYGCISSYGRSNRGRSGLVLVKNWVHPDDAEALNNLAAALKMSRNLR